ncbi:hypothetical protein VNO78_22065 [Psophocarpus tetragonolobus]|uniref:Uncharacterized protein n=1 Tax=Psophocarpus tetragonolobus TaxID=3891 RepID=A0AAN9SHH8_PSOTE
MLMIHKSSSAIPILSLNLSQQAVSLGEIYSSTLDYTDVNDHKSAWKFLDNSFLNLSQQAVSLGGISGPNGFNATPGLFKPLQL